MFYDSSSNSYGVDSDSNYYDLPQSINNNEARVVVVWFWSPDSYAMFLRPAVLGGVFVG